MRCELWQERLVEEWETNPSPELERHVGQCEACARLLRDMRLVKAGFGLLQSEAVPEVSLGFPERLVRRLTEMGRGLASVSFSNGSEGVSSMPLWR